ncbi:MAG: response regulator [Promethearchaeota archaeon]|nr:MAG: response regulator [Candidatus Lokiarchaeota archaeon]
MNELILVVDDEIDILENIKLLLEINNYKVITANNGLEALEVLSKLDENPDLIVSDISMDEMDGYEFFKEVSNNPNWYHTPFIFLSGLSGPKDIRLGKLLGVDDYLTKPFNNADLLAIISGKLRRKKRTETINEDLKDILDSYKIDVSSSISENQKDFVNILYVVWDDKIGPNLENSYPKKSKLSKPIQDIGTQLYHSIASIYGQENIVESTGFLLRIENIKSEAYIFYDSYHDSSVRGRERRYMLALLAPRINYFQTIKLRKILSEISKKIKEKKDWDIKDYWEKITDLLTYAS